MVFESAIWYFVIPLVIKFLPFAVWQNLSLNISIIRILSINRMRWFKCHFYRGLFVTCNHIFGIAIILVHSIWSLVQMLSLHYSGRYYWVNRLTLQLIVFQNTATCLRSLNVPNVPFMSYSNHQYIGPCVFRIDWNVAP